MKRRKKSMKLIFVIIILLVVVFIAWFYSHKNNCKNLKQEIEKMLEESNYCEKDTDCVAIHPMCPFGCVILVNKNIDMNLINKKMNKYGEQCMMCLYMCIFPGNLTCEENKCISIS